VWDARTGVELTILKGHGDAVTGVAISPDAGRIVTGSVDNTAMIWELLPFGQALVDAAKAHVPRCLTPAERERYFLPPVAPHWCVTMRKWPYDATPEIPATALP
jgi:WD40 repeat protein